MKILKEMDPHIPLIITSLCNNNCLFCTCKLLCGSRGDLNSINPSTEKVKIAIKNAFYKTRNANDRILKLTGGEVTIRPDFLDLISFAKKVGFERIRIMTNGRKFADKKFLKEAIKRGLNCFDFALHDSDRESHERITRVPGSFRETVSGIKNCATFSSNSNIKMEIGVNTIINKFNCSRLLKIGVFLHNLGIKRWALMELFPGGKPEDSFGTYREFAPNLIELSLYLNNHLDRFAHLINQIDLHDFPWCLFEPKIFKMKNIIFANILNKRDYSQSKIIGPSPKTEVTKKSENRKITIPHNPEKTKFYFCEKCIYFGDCTGIMKYYFKLFGNKEIKILAQKHNLLRQ